MNPKPLSVNRLMVPSGIAQSPHFTRDLPAERKQKHSAVLHQSRRSFYCADVARQRSLGSSSDKVFGDKIVFTKMRDRTPLKKRKEQEDSVF